jgi:hypothetical protein
MRASFLLAATVLVSGAVGAVSACGSSDGGGSTFDGPKDAGTDQGPLDGLQSIDVSPPTADLLAGDTNGSQTFSAQGHFADGSTRDLTSLVTWKSSADTLLSASGPTATATGARGGDATMSAFVGAVTGTAAVHVKWVKTVLADGVAPGSDARFKGATEDAALAPALAYPLSGVIVPPNIPPIEVQWKPAAATDLFDVVVSGPNLEAHLVTGCNAIDATGGCGFLPDAATWAAITATLEGQDPGSVVVRGAGATAGAAGTSASASMQMASEDLRGGLYYFNTRATPPDNKPGIFRYDFATKKVGPFFTQGACAGCHALSADGTKMLAPICTTERGCGRPLQLAVVDVATKQVVTPPMPVGDSDTQTWTPDNAYYLTTPQCSAYDTVTAPYYCSTLAPGKMTLVSAATNTVVATAPAGAGAMYPSFSNDGKKLVYARAGTLKGPLSIQSSSLFWMTFDGTTSTPTFGAEQTLLMTSGTSYENNYHPSFSPDDKWIVFSRSNCLAGDDPASGDINKNVCDSYNDYTARTWVVSAAGGTPVELATANGTGRNTVSWPRWAPFKTSYKGGDLFWVTVAATRDYGFRATHTLDAQGNPATGVTQLWLVGFDPAKAAAGADPSFAPLWLPFQDVTSSNHIGQWATKIVGTVN